MSQVPWYTIAPLSKEGAIDTAVALPFELGGGVTVPDATLQSHEIAPRLRFALGTLPHVPTQAEFRRVRRQFTKKLVNRRLRIYDSRRRERRPCLASRYPDTA